MIELDFFLVIVDKFLERAISNLTPEEREHLVGYCVNPAIKKEIEADIPIIGEWNLPWYEPQYQNAFYCEYGLFPHLVKNPELLAGLTHVGILHYDVKFEESSVNEIISSLEEEPDTIYYINRRGNGDLCLNPEEVGLLSEFVNTRMNARIDPDKIWNEGWISEAMTVVPVRIAQEFGNFLLAYADEIEDIIRKNRWGIMDSMTHRVCGLVERMWGFYLVSTGLPMKRMRVVHEWGAYRHLHQYMKV